MKKNTLKILLAAAMLCVVALNAIGQAASSLTRIVSPSSQALLSISQTNAIGGYVTRSVAVSNLFNATNMIFRAGDYTKFRSFENGSPAQLAFINYHGVTTGKGVLSLGGLSGDVVINPDIQGGVVQIGATAQTGNYIYLQYATVPTAALPYGFSHPLEFRSVTTNGNAHAAIQGFASPNPVSPHGFLKFYSQPPHWNPGNHNPDAPDTAGNEVARLGTNGFEVASGYKITAQTIIATNIIATNLVQARELLATNKIYVGSGVNSSSTPGIDLIAGYGDTIQLGGDFASIGSRTSGSDKYTGMSLFPRNNGDIPITLFEAKTTGGGAEIKFGGNSSVRGPLTDIQFQVGVDSTDDNSARLHLQIVNSVVTSTNFVTTGTLGIRSNTVATWPTVPSAHGEARFVNSNGVVFVLTSGMGLTWTSTNKIAP